VWSTLVGPGTSLGGIEWGTAYDLQRIYIPIADPFADPFGVPYKLANGQAASGGSWRRSTRRREIRLAGLHAGRRRRAWPRQRSQRSPLRRGHGPLGQQHVRP
jgi:hypothetical protein